ncbi:carbohydrate ABC transporter permease [Paenibacillus sp. PAMC21692]|uniref:carbohydrate ABC transporter permease n=1 Tax=Paenibacillus sp. PAMC21692 TaxID=2762320 RepID=UPI00164E0C3B|nr:carbohydrate ABC transporter permease [Paenibacillus sp. PAMC21692]QNK55897.1 carbohydrate ABC transporter permease [Paenibacillus sp. PAMC21692]
MRRQTSDAIRHIMLVLFSVVMLYPIAWWIGASLESTAEISSLNVFPSVPVWSNFREGWTAIPGYSFTRFYLNTFLLEIAVLAAAIFSCTLVAFGFARLDFPLRKFWFAILMLTFMLPAQVLIVPQYAMFYQFGWINTYWPFIVPQMLAGGTGGTFFVFLLVQFIRGIPKELDESAKIDGCTWFGLYWRMVIPLTKSAIATVLIFCFLWNWDDFLGHLLYINSVDKYTVTLALKMLNDSEGHHRWGQLLAMSLVSVVPATLVFAVAQKQLVEGIATTGIK